MTPTQILLASVLPLAACAAVSDLRTGHIPNRLVFWGLLGGTLLHVGLAVALPASPSLSLAARFGIGAAGALGGMLCAAAVPYLLFRLRAMGGGDVKLLAALGATLGPSLSLQLLLLAFVLALAYAPALLAYRGELWLRFKAGILRLLGRLLRRANPERVEGLPGYALCFAPPVFAASVLLSCLHAWR